MEKTYIITIRDLSNEAEFLTSESKRIAEKQEQIYKNLQIKGHSAIQAIHSFLEHQAEEIRKTNLFIAKECMHISIAIYEKNIEFRINHHLCTYSEKEKTYLLSDGKKLEDDIRLLKLLIKYWKDFKKAFLDEIQLQYNLKIKELEKHEKIWDENSHIFDNFEI